ncbi:MAG: cytochrome c [Acidobacteriota bacterium]
MHADKRRFATIIFTALLCFQFASAHDIITTPVTWSREISRIVYAKCASCHRPKGSAFSLLTYKDARPWAVAIREATLQRQMPPWGAVKGFGDFRNDQALTPEQLELIVSWTEGGVPEGDAKDMPAVPKLAPTASSRKLPGEILLTADLRLTRAFTLDGLWPQIVPSKADIKITAELPEGRIEPLLWIQDYSVAFGHPFLLRRPLRLAAGTVIRGVPTGAKIRLLPAQAKRAAR